MSNTTIVLICVTVLLVSVLLIILLLREGGPKYQPVPIMTPNEVEFFRRISKAVPDAFVFPQVAMSALIAPRDMDGKKRMAAFRKISQNKIGGSHWLVKFRKKTLLNAPYFFYLKKKKKKKKTADEEHKRRTSKQNTRTKHTTNRINK